MLTMLAQTEFFTSLVKENTRVKDDYVNATVWSKAFGREWRVYRQSKRCKRTIDNLVKEYHITIRDVVEAKPGKVPETWVHPEIAIDFAEWLSPAFSSFVKRIFIRYLKADPTLAADILARNYNNERVERAKCRLHCSDTNKTTAQLAFASGLPIAQLHNDRYYGLYDEPASKLREMAGLKAKQTPLDAMSAADLNFNSLANYFAVKSGKADRLYHYALSLRNAFETETGQKLVPQWEEQKMRADQAKTIAYGQTYQTELPLSPPPPPVLKSGRPLPKVS